MISQYLTEKGVVVKGQGTEKVCRCMFCNEKKTHLFINDLKGVFHCVKCNEAGNIWKLKRHYGDIVIYSPWKKAYTKPKPELVDRLLKSLGKIGMDYLTKERMFTPSIIQEFKLGYKKGFISIPYYKDREVVNIKYRSIEGKRYEREEGGESILYNIDNINRKQNIIIVEGEFDCISAYQLGFKNVVSTTIGSGGFKNDWLDFFDSSNRDVFIAYDNDESGEQGAEKIADKIGRFKCFRVKLPLKDMNECLMAGYTKENLQKYFDEAKNYKPANLVPVDIALERLYTKLFSDSSDKDNVLVPTMPGLNSKLGGLRNSEITVITGETGSGKSTFTLNVIYDLLRMGKRALIVSAEMKISTVVGKLVSMYSGQPYYTLTKEKFQSAEGEFAKYGLFFVDVHGEVTVNTISTHVEYCARRYNVEYVLLDHLHYFLRPKDNMVQEIETFMKQIVGIALKTGVNVLMIAHPAKLKNESGFVHMNDIKGGSSIKQDAHNIITLWRNKDQEEKGINEVLVNIEKVRDERGQIGKFFLEFDRSSQTYKEMNNGNK